MIQCPKCGTMNPDGARNCRECYYPFGLEKAVQETGTPPAAPPPRQYIPPTAPVPGSQPPRDMKVIRVRPLESKRKVHPAIWIVVAVAVVCGIFAAAWFITHSSGGPDSYLEEVFQNMNDLAGWEADLRVDSTDFASTFYGGWEGKMVYQTPDRFSLSAYSLDGGNSFGLRIIDERLYIKDFYSSHWSDMGQLSEGDNTYLHINPIWNEVLLEQLSPEEEEGLEEVDGRMCKVLSFDQEVNIEMSLGDESMEIPYHYAGKFYVENTKDLLISMDYIEELSGFGVSSRTHYQYGFYSLGDATVVDIPSGI